MVSIENDDLLVIQKVVEEVELIIGEKLDKKRKELLLNDIRSNYKEISGQLYNSYVDELAIEPYKKMSVLYFIERFLKLKPIMAGNCTLYKNKNLKGKNVTGSFVKFLKDSRSAYKKERDVTKKQKIEVLEKDKNADTTTLDDLIAKDDSYQSIFKIFTNAYYGCIGMKKFIFNDKNSGPAVTGCGVQIITTLIQSFEAFIADNWKFDNYSDILKFLELSKRQKREDIEYYKIPKITKEDLKKRLIKKLKHSVTEYIERYPKITAKIDEVLDGMTKEEIQNAYYRNNLIEFLDNEDIMEDIGTALNFFIPSGNVKDIQKQIAEEGNEELKRAVEKLNSNIMNIVFFNYYFEDRYAFAIRGQNHAVIVVDTDSNFLLLDHFFRVVGKHYQIVDENNEMDSKLRLTIGSLFTYPILNAAEKFLLTYAEAHNIDDELKPELNLKNEFFYKRLMLTYAKKNYAGLTMSQEGVLKDPMELDVKGLALMKSITSKYIKERFLSIIEKKILSPEYIDINDIIHDYIVFSNEVIESLKKGEMTYSKPLKYGMTYKDPFRQEVVRGVVLWNTVMKEKNKIEFLENVNSVKLVGETLAQVNSIIKQNEKYFTEKDMHYIEKMKKCIFEGNNDVLKSFGLSVICVPKSEKVLPHWVLPFIDVDEMVKNALSPTLIVLQSLGIMVDDVGRDERFTNIIDL